MRIQFMMALLAGTITGVATLATSPVEAQNRLGRPVAGASPSIARVPMRRPDVGRPAAQARPARPAMSDRRPRPGANGSGNIGNRPGRPGGGRGPENVVIVNGRPGAGYYENGRYYGGGHYGGGHYGNGYYDDDRRRNDGDDFLEFVGKTAAVTAGVSVVSAIIGSIVKDKPSNDCQQQIQNGRVYLLCDGVWYTPAEVGGQSGYEVVVPPSGVR
jgi:hypothetical protein